MKPHSLTTPILVSAALGTLMGGLPPALKPSPDFSRSSLHCTPMPDQQSTNPEATLYQCTPTSTQRSSGAPRSPLTCKSVPHSQSRSTSETILKCFSAETQTTTVPVEPAQLSPSVPTTAKTVRYECRKDGNQFFTIAHNERGPIDLIAWESQYFGSQWTPERRCNVVTQRFQKFSDAKLLHFVSYDRLNNYNVLCIMESETSQFCMKDTLLLTLERRDDPAQVLASLFNTDTIIVRGRKPVVNINEILRTRPPRSELPFSPEDELNTPTSPQNQSDNDTF